MEETCIFAYNNAPFQNGLEDREIGKKRKIERGENTEAGSNKDSKKVTHGMIQSGHLKISKQEQYYLIKKRAAIV